MSVTELWTEEREQVSRGSKGGQAANSPFSCGGGDRLGLLVRDGQVLQCILKRLLLAVLLIVLFLLARRSALVFVVLLTLWTGLGIGIVQKWALSREAAAKVERGQA